MIVIVRGELICFSCAFVRYPLVQLFIIQLAQTVLQVLVMFFLQKDFSRSPIRENKRKRAFICHSDQMLKSIL